MEKVNLKKMLKEIELQYINDALLVSNNNISQASKLLGMNRTTLREKLTSLGLLKREPCTRGKQISSLFKNHPNNIEDTL